MQILVQVKAGSRKGPLVEERSVVGHLTVFVRERAINGQANRAMISLLANFYKTSPKNIEVVHGKGSRFKRVQINELGP